MNIADRLKKWVTDYSALLKDKEHGDSVTVGGKVIEVETIDFQEEEDTTCFILINDGVGEVSIMIPPGVYDEYEDDLKEDNVLILKGRVFSISDSHSNKETKVIAYSVEKIDASSW